MIFFIAEGQLGNQIFQYVFLKTINKKNEKVVVAGFESLKAVFEVDDVLFINKTNRWVSLLLQRFVKPILSLLANSRFISKVNVDYDNPFDHFLRESSSFTITKGLFNSLTYVKLGFFQSEYFFDHGIAKKLMIKKVYISKAQKLLQNIPINAHKVFVHVRRGDYQSHKVYGSSALLPLTYFKKQIEWFVANRKDCYFIFLSDDSYFVNMEFDYVNNKIISIDNDYGTDFAVMTLCRSAILSPSSFSWWGSYFMNEKDIIFAPKYWLGFNTKTEYHKNGTPSFAEEVEL